MNNPTTEALAAMSTAIAAAVAATTQGVQAAQGVNTMNEVAAFGPSLFFSIVAGVAAGGVSFGLLKGRVESAQKRADESHTRHDKTDEKVDKILEQTSRTREMVAELIGAERERKRRAGDDE